MARKDTLVANYEFFSVTLLAKQLDVTTQTTRERHFQLSYNLLAPGQGEKFLRKFLEISF
jgi:hypothetical protein